MHSYVSTTLTDVAGLPGGLVPVALMVFGAGMVLGNLLAEPLRAQHRHAAGGWIGGQVIAAGYGYTACSRVNRRAPGSGGSRSEFTR